MSGTPAPVYIIVEPFGASAAALPPTSPGAVTLPIPVPSQVGIVTGAASFTDGFPPATMVDPEGAGGVPPFGQDMNGILYMLSAYCAMLQAGQRVPFSTAAATAFTGYAVGAEVASVSTPGRVWVNQTAGNTNDPDVTPTGWASRDPLSSVLVPAAGTFNNIVLPGASDYALDINSAAGAVTYTGFIAQRNGQKLFISNIGANLVTIAALTGSTAGNQVRAPTDLSIVQNQTLTLEYISSLSKWLAV